jgi:Cu(I)/Ag(I) efflux system membrane fusion protein
MNDTKRKWTPWIAILIIVIVAGSGYLYLQHGKSGKAGDSKSVAADDEIYVCPMHPQVTSDHPADCPICGMKLVKRQTNAVHDMELDSMAATVNLSPTQEVLANVRTELPVKATFTAMRSVPGRIVAREEAQWKANARVMGRIDRLYIATPGEPVQQGQPLYDLFSPDLANAQREYQLAKQSSDPQTRDLLVSAARSKLLSLGIQNAQLSLLEKSGDVHETLTFRAPHSGVLTGKMITEGQWVMPGMDMLDFVDLSEVWVEGTIYEQDISNVHLGDRVSVELNGNPMQHSTAKVSYVAPTVDPMTRTMVFRAVLPNANGDWKPEQFVEVSWTGQQTQEALSVPEDAVLATGENNRVWVKIGDGRFEPRTVVLGPQQDGRIAILSGLRQTDEVVSSGGYLIDSDAQIKNIGMGHHHDMSGGSMSDSDMSGDTHDSGQNAHSEMLQPAVAPHAPASEAAVRDTHPKPEAAVGLYYCPMDPEVTSDKPGRCPKCGMNLIKREG